MPYDAPKTPLFLRLHPEDDVVIALRETAAGTRLEGEGVIEPPAEPASFMGIVRKDGRVATRIKWWEDYTARNRGDMNNNPSPGNKAGGLTTILEKSLGAAAKGGTTNLVDVYEYAEPVTAKGFVFIVEGGATVAEKGREIFELMLRVASGEKSKSEVHGFGADEFIPWQIGAVM